METRAMKRDNISVEEKQAAIVLLNLHKDNSVLKKLKQDKETKDELLKCKIKVPTGEFYKNGKPKYKTIVEENVLCRLNDEGERMRKENIRKKIILEKAYEEIKILKLIKEYKENQEIIREMIKSAKDPLTKSVLDDEIIRVGVEMSGLYNSLNLY